MKNPLGILSNIFRRRNHPALFHFNLDSFGTPEEALEQLSRMDVLLTLARIDNMRRWEREMKWYSAVVVVFVVLNTGLVTATASVFNLGAIVFLYVIHSHSVARFANRRAGLLADLEAQPHTEVWWYDAWTRNPGRT